MIELNWTKNENDAIQGVKGKYYARVEYKDTITASQLAKHMSEHTTSFSRGEILGWCFITCNNLWSVFNFHSIMIIFFIR